MPRSKGKKGQNNTNTFPGFNITEDIVTSKDGNDIGKKSDQKEKETKDSKESKKKKGQDNNDLLCNKLVWNYNDPGIKSEGK